MKPIKLEMTAFGSYARFTSVDFRKLDHCLYLITGDTGAGKTTLFDGIMFALYGVASGKGDKRYRTFEMMHCDYVDKSEDTVIKLDFEHMGRKYTVERRFHFKKKRSTGEYEKTTPQAKLWEPDRDVLEQTDAVTDRITELLGMNADQFRKIVMLAQGEFKKFLDADSEEKNQILGELFDHSAYVWFQEIFDRARKRLARRRLEEGDGRIQSAMERFMMPEETTEEGQEVFTPGHSGLEGALGGLTEKDLAKQQALTKQLGTCRKEANGLREQLGKAEAQNQKLDELAQKELALRGLQEKMPDMARLKERAGRVGKALQKVIPKQKLQKRAEAVYLDTCKKIEDLSQELCNSEKEKTEKKERLDICRRENEPETERLGNEIAEIEKALPRYQELEELSRRQQEAQKAAKEACRKREDSEKGKSAAAEKIALLKSGINELDGIDAIAERRKAALDKIVEKLDRLTVRDGIKDQFDEIRRRREALKGMQDAQRKLLSEAGKLESVYHNLYQAFMKGQAGLLARGLEQELQEKGEALCPVCGTAFQSAASHCFAAYGEGTPGQKDVDKARAAFEKKEKERQKGSEEITGAEAAIKGLEEHVLGRLRELKPDCPDWADLDGTHYLEGVIKEFGAEREKAEREWEEAKAQCGRLKSLKRECAQQETLLEDCENSLRTYGEMEQRLQLQSGSLQAAIAELKKSLKYQDSAEAEKQKNSLQKEREKGRKSIRDAEGAFDRANEQYNALSGALESTKDSLPAFREEKEQAENSLLAELKEQGFQSLEEVDMLLGQLGGTETDAENWLRSKESEIRNFENEKANTEERIRILEEETRHLERTDLERLRERIRHLDISGQELQEKLELCKKQYENHRDIAETVRDANRFLKETESAWKRLDSLADLAIGTNSAGGRISFDRYVMGYVFREVLGMANQRLDIMSGGRYELLHEMGAGRNNAKAGLEIMVLDMATGKCRPVSSLSGGESFFVSLALALGLSDVVQNHAGGKRLDALFIDEGFGTLDNEVLDHALVVLNQLTEGQRLVGIISHVAKLEECIPQQIQVKSSEKGSMLRIVN